MSSIPILPTIALIVAAGSGERYGGDVPKQYETLNGQTLLRRSIEAFLQHPKIDGVRVVIRRQDHARYKAVADGLTLFPCVVGGKSRQESVWRGLESLRKHAPARVLIHDAARPLVSPALISRVVTALDDASAVLPAQPVADTLRRGVKIMDRQGLSAAQTPQGFDYQEILAAHRQFSGQEATDDIALAHLAGLDVITVPGERSNIKLTMREDHAIMQALLNSTMETRIGSGVDVHPFTPHPVGAPGAQQVLFLCGVAIPHTQRLKGHSDADAGLHALVDALLGAMALGDIGSHFPPSDAQWRGVDSARFVSHAMNLLEDGGGRVINADITILCETPKIGPYREAMQARVAALLGVTPDRVGIKATTTEGLGFLGRGEGIMAQANVSLAWPA